ncbi:MAG: hypothetical protein J7L19_04550 [Dehalococcoidia bacterium]|nr:hypothetical protein [Dehalococcoidia bacterium]
MSIDFTLDKYRSLCYAALNSQYSFLTVGAYLTTRKLIEKCIILRHDVDRKPQRALRMARVEREFGIKSTYYFRFNRKVFRTDLIKEIASMGHEIGYHYETLDKAKGDYARAIQIFGRELEEFRKIADVKTICMHGNPLTKWDNRDLWTKYDFKEFGLIGEAYLSFRDVPYLSDTGRTWSDQHKIKDHLPQTTSNHSKSDGSPMVTSTDDIIELIKKEQLRHAYLLVHPERWSNSLIGWITDLVMDTAVNLAKRILMLRKGQTRQEHSE